MVYPQSIWLSIIDFDQDFFGEKMLELKVKILFCFEIPLCISLQYTFYDVDRRPSKDGWFLLKVCRNQSFYGIYYEDDYKHK